MWCICISKESESGSMKLREHLLACGFDGDERRLQALVEWLHSEDVSCLGHLVGAVNEMRGANAFQEEDISLLKEEVVLAWGLQRVGLLLIRKRESKLGIKTRMRVRRGRC